MVAAAGEKGDTFSLMEDFGTSSSIDVKCLFLEFCFGKYLK